MPPSPVPPNSAHTPWDDIRGLYEAGAATVADLARRFSLHPSTIRRRARAGAWRKNETRPEAQEIAQTGPQPATGGLCPGLAACFHRPALHARLYAGLGRRIEAFAASAARLSDIERDAKILTVLVQTLKRLADMDNALNANFNNDQQGDVAQIRQELARRLSLLANAQEEGSFPEEPE